MFVSTLKVFFADIFIFKFYFLFEKFRCNRTKDLEWEINRAKF